MSGASERANGRASGPVLTSRFLLVPDHSAPAAAAPDVDDDDDDATTNGNAVFSPLPTTSSSAPNGIPSLMRAAPYLHGSSNGAGSPNGGGLAAATTTNGVGLPKGRYKAKASTTRVGGRGVTDAAVGGGGGSEGAGSGGVRALMCDVGRDAYEAFATYQEDCTPPPAPPVANGATPLLGSTMPTTMTTLKKTTPPPPLHPLPPHGPSVSHAFAPAGKLSAMEYESLSGSLKRKLVSAGQKLDRSTSAEEDKALCALIQSYAKALEAVNAMQSS